MMVNTATVVEAACLEPKHCRRKPLAARSCAGCDPIVWNGSATRAFFMPTGLAFNEQWAKSGLAPDE
jgi:hypothetical protein